MADPEAPTDLKCWREILDNFEDLDRHAVFELVGLIRTSTIGAHEGNRIIFHLLKDSTSGRSYGHGGPTAWMMRAVHEAQQAMRNMDAWHGERSSGKGGGKGGRSSSSAARWSRTGPRA